MSLQQGIDVQIIINSNCVFMSCNLLLYCLRQWR